jgi:hypothetical protein
MKLLTLMITTISLNAFAADPMMLNLPARNNPALSEQLCAQKAKSTQAQKQTSDKANSDSEAIR